VSILRNHLPIQENLNKKFDSKTMTPTKKNIFIAALSIIALTGIYFTIVGTRNYMFNQAVLALKEGNYLVASTKLKPLANMGDSHAQYLLGNIYAFGWGVEKNDAAAVHWYRRSGRWTEKYRDPAAPAMFYVGESYLKGIGVSKDEGEAKKWLEMSANGGYLKASEQLLWVDQARNKNCPHNEEADCERTSQPQPAGK
jgi:hypothetical protein